MLAVVVSFLLGLFTTVAFAVFGEYRNAIEEFRPAAVHRQVQHESMSFDSSARLSRWYETYYVTAHGYMLYAKAPAYGEVLPGWLPDSYFRDDRSSLDYLLAVGTGWPMRSLRYAMVRDFEPDTGLFIDTERHVLKLTLPGGEVMRVGYAPIWCGLLVNSSVFGAAWFVLMFVPGYLRRELRVRGGRCVICGYDLCETPRGLPCPECGSAVVRFGVGAETGLAGKAEVGEAGLKEDRGT